MANTISRTVAGLLGYEDFSGQTDGDSATSAYFDIVSPALAPWLKQTLWGKECMATQAGDAYDYTTHGAEKTLDLTELVMQKAFASPFVGTWYQTMWRGGDTVYRAILGNSLYATGGFAVSGVLFNARTYYASGSVAANTWYYQKDRFKAGDHSHIKFDQSKNIKGHFKGARATALTGSAAKGFYVQVNDANQAMTELSLISSDTLTIAGIVSGMSVALLDASDNLLYVQRSTGTSLTIDLEKEWYPLSAKIRVIGTDGSTLLTSTTAEDIYGGDTWTYSGDYTGASGGGVISIMGGNIL